MILGMFAAGYLLGFVAGWLCCRAVKEIGEGR